MLSHLCYFTDHSYCIIETLEIIKQRFKYDTLVSQLDNYDVKPSDSSIKLLKLKNPWGHKSKWNGKYGKHSHAWDLLSPELVARLKVHDQPHGVFYLSYNEFIDYFDELYLVHTNLNAYYAKNMNCPSVNWTARNFYGQWHTNKNTSGGIKKFNLFMFY